MLKFATLSRIIEIPFHFAKFLYIRIILYDSFAVKIFFIKIKSTNVYRPLLMLNVFQDFATHSLEISETTPGLSNDNEESDSDESDDLKQFQMRRTWESRLDVQK